MPHMIRISHIFECLKSSPHHILHIFALFARFDQYRLLAWSWLDRKLRLSCGAHGWQGDDRNFRALQYPNYSKFLLRHVRNIPEEEEDEERARRVTESERCTSFPIKIIEPHWTTLNMVEWCWFAMLERTTCKIPGLRSGGWEDVWCGRFGIPRSSSHHVERWGA